MHIKRFLALQQPDIGRAIAVGVGQAPEQLTDLSLQYEIGRAPVNLVAYDFDKDQLIFKAPLDEKFDGTVYEVGLYSREDSSAGTYGSRILASFDSDTEFWMSGASAASYRTTNTRIGNDSAYVTAAASGNATITYPDITIDLSGNSAADTFNFAFHSANTNLSSIRYRFLSDASNYYDITIGPGGIATGFNILSALKGSAVVTGTPNWGTITSLEVTAFAGAGGSIDVGFEGIRIEDVDTIDSGYVLVSRVVLTIPFTKVAGAIQEVEFPLGVTI